MDAIPWYKSPVFAGSIVAVITNLLALTGLSERFAEVDVAKLVDAGLQIFGTLAAGWAAWKRWRSTIQPLALTKEGAVSKSLPQCHPFAVVLSMLLAAALLSGCVTWGVKAAQTNEQRAAALLGDFTIFQQAALKVGQDTSVPLEVRRAILDAPIAAKPFVDELDAALREYRAVALELERGTTTEEKVAIAAQNLVRWITEVQPRIARLRELIEGVR